MFKRLSKIICVLILGVSFSITTYADDSSNIANIATNTANTAARLNTIINNYLADIKSDVAAIDTNIGNIKTAVANTLTTAVNGINTRLDSIKGYVDGIEGYIDGLEGKLDNIYSRQATINTNIANIGTNTDTIISSLSGQSTSLDNTYNLLNTYTNGYLRDIRSEMLKISDNIVFNRSSASADTITLSNNATLGSVSYTLKPVTQYTFSVTNNVLTPTATYSYGNFHNHIMVSYGNVLGLTISGFNYLHDRLFTDLGYIGSELHLTYGLIDNFKDANHTDIIAFKDANHTDLLGFWASNHTDITTFKSAFDSWVTLWKAPAKLIYILKDVLSVRRIEENPTTVTLTTFDGNTTYALWSYNQKYMAYNSNSHQFQIGEQLRYVNFPGMLHMALWGINESLTALGNYHNDNSVANSISNSVTTLSNNLTSYQAAEQQLQNRVSSSISSFVPDLSLFGGFVALSWVSNYLQQVYISLGTYGTVIMIGLLLAVCMQFIGYFRYKY